MNQELNEAQATETTELVDVPFEVPEGFKILSDEEVEKLSAQLVEDRRDKWEVQEIVDNAIAAGEMNTLLRNEFLYEFKKGWQSYPRTDGIDDLTLGDRTEHQRSHGRTGACRGRGKARIHRCRGDARSYEPR